MPLFLFLEVHHAVWNVEIFAEAPFVAGAQNGGNSGLQVVVDVGSSDVRKWFKKFGGLPGFQSASEILAGAEKPELL